MAWCQADIQTGKGLPGHSNLQTIAFLYCSRPAYHNVCYWTLRSSRRVTNTALHHKKVILRLDRRIQKNRLQKKDKCSMIIYTLKGKGTVNLTCLFCLVMELLRQPNCQRHQRGRFLLLLEPSPFY